MKLRNRQLGQGMTEYIIIVALIAVAAIGVYRLFGDTLRNQTAGLAQEMSGQDSSQQVSNAQQAAGDAASQAGEEKDLSNYGDGNRK
ncbi:Flp family type IVb pilin [Alloalcanivorax profundimaris]|uniref:Pilus assembly protein n=1 Tax=Alloalcanivorax profundimaris TaxID=2735259 RepID=A0ABS0AQ73_9GAMM|nr:pilus assembly protein [Alloalcanivorax profundimaris]MAY09491.1 pilus assembly protein [Alcanivorax sp.]MBM1142573.1 pilus assembly protein [Alcanivorax sp. ZXX171]MCQ6260533.1 pilus assembly protein [Alcanivorax sp. MM125-6]QJX02647.1 pilus assembly protein [Alcanivorax sp. IO_7]UWN50329.1 hypothetical protein ASALC70_02550 [Alcanivorax sp. ALC70]|tara:strand:+ start:909 stop:1169 length:261 start_codon:yes stop_codon:yes gene_type:complete